MVNKSDLIELHDLVAWGENSAGLVRTVDVAVAKRNGCIEMFVLWVLAGGNEYALRELDSSVLRAFVACHG